QVVAVRGSAVDLIPPVHRAAGPVGERARMEVAEITRRLVGGVGAGDGPGGRLARRGPFGAGEGAEVVVERVVLFDDDDDVLDGRAPRQGGATAFRSRAGPPVVRP